MAAMASAAGLHVARTSTGCTTVTPLPKPFKELPSILQDEDERLFLLKRAQEKRERKALKKGQRK